MSVALRQPTTLVEFLDWEERQEMRYEFDGVGAVAMTGGSAGHNRIVYNLRNSIERRLPEPCQAFRTDRKVLVNGRARYPDILITCRPPGPADLVAEHPLIVFEILSPGNSHTDRIDKVIGYQAAPSIQRYVVLEQTTIGATVFVRQTDGWHATTLQTGATVTLTEVDIAFPLDECYARLEMRPPPPTEA